MLPQNLAPAFLVRQFDSGDSSVVTIQGSSDPEGGYLEIGIPIDDKPIPYEFSSAIDDSDNYTYGPGIDPKRGISIVFECESCMGERGVLWNCLRV